MGVFLYYEKSFLLLHCFLTMIFMDSSLMMRTKRRARVALLFQYFLSGFIFSALLSRFPALKDLYGMSVSQLSLVLLSMSVGSLLTMPLCVHLVGKFGSKKLSIVGFVYMALLPVLTIMPNLYALYAACLVYGAFVTLLDVSINGNSIIVENAYKRPIISLFHALFYVGVCAGAMLSILMMVQGVTITTHYLLVSLFSVLSFLSIRRFFLKETITRAKVMVNKKIMFPKGILLTLAFVALCGRVVEGSISDWSTFYMKTVVQFPDHLAPLGLVIYSAFMSVGRFFCDAIRARYKESTILLGCCILAVDGVLIIIADSSFYFAFVGLFVAGLGISCLVPIIYSLAGRQKDVTPAMGIAMVNTISGTGFLFGPFVIGLLGDHFSMRASFLYIWILALVMTVLTLYYRKRERSLGSVNF